MKIILIKGLANIIVCNHVISKIKTENMLTFILKPCYVLLVYLYFFKIFHTIFYP
jgi:hypothetical protein